MEIVSFRYFSFTTSTAFLISLNLIISAVRADEIVFKLGDENAEAG